MKPARYHGALVALHWILALLLIMMLAVGSLALKHLPNSSPDKIFALRIHMVVGVVILLLTLGRLAVRCMTAHPPAATSGNVLLDRLAPGMHWALYILVLLMAGSGIAISALAGLPGIVFGGIGILPVNFEALPPRALHGLVAKLLILFIGLHVAAGLYHQIIRRDGLFSRMWFGSR